MQQHQLHNYLRRYFIANDSAVVRESGSHLEIQLSIEMDKLLMNRPFYWHYLEKTGGIPQPLKLTLITNQATAPADLKGEPIHFGAPRLHQIFQSTRELGGYIHLYENVQANGNQSIPLHPWLCLNAKISFQCDRKKEVLLSLGLNLIHGQIVQQFFNRLQAINFSQKIPDYCFSLSPLIKTQSGIIRLEKMIQAYAESEDPKWAEDAIKRWEEDLHLLERFYEHVEDKPESYELEKTALQEQYEPRIEVEIINGGIFYLQQQVFSNQ
ncbi:YqhG family protein [Halalkalibacterium ligniniphilum]|uniref:YqhG family protein n=1 Tax=Halalkalibacterium ligniniphilum TaxID=1134413 RepID=UPI00034B6AA4|nr:YqhG family protein [Halalkalibacterium ligniniphilum]